jgi:uncharacterized protein (UPF0212 family)
LLTALFVLLVKIRVKLVDYKLFKALKYRAKTKGGKMICPKCKEEINSVVVISDCSQIGLLKENTNTIEEYVDLEVEAIQKLTCPKCLETITRYIKD